MAIVLLPVPSYAQTPTAAKLALVNELQIIHRQAAEISLRQSGSVLASNLPPLSEAAVADQKATLLQQLEKLSGQVEAQDEPRIRQLYRQILWTLEKPLPFEAVALVNKEALNLLFNARCHPLDPILNLMCDDVTIQDPNELKLIAIEELGYTAHPLSVYLLTEIVLHGRITSADGSIFRSFSSLHPRLKALEALGNLGWLVSAMLEPQEFDALLAYIKSHEQDKTWRYFGKQWFGSELDFIDMLRRTKERLILREPSAVYTMERWVAQKEAWYPQRLKNLVPDMAYFVMSCFGWDENAKVSQEKCDNNIKSLFTASIYRFGRDTVKFIGHSVWEFRPVFRTLLSDEDEAATWRELGKGPRGYADAWMNMGLAVLAVDGAVGLGKGVLKAQAQLQEKVVQKEIVRPENSFETEFYRWLDDPQTLQPREAGNTFYYDPAEAFANGSSYGRSNNPSNPIGGGGTAVLTERPIVQPAVQNNVAQNPTAPAQPQASALGVSPNPTLLANPPRQNLIPLDERYLQSEPEEQRRLKEAAERARHLSELYLKLRPRRLDGTFMSFFEFIVAHHQNPSRFEHHFEPLPNAERLNLFASSDTAGASSESTTLPASTNIETTLAGKRKKEKKPTKAPVQNPPQAHPVITNLQEVMIDRILVDPRYQEGTDIRSLMFEAVEAMIPETPKALWTGTQFQRAQDLGKLVDEHERAGRLLDELMRTTASRPEQWLELTAEQYVPRLAVVTHQDAALQKTTADYLQSSAKLSDAPKMVLLSPYFPLQAPELLTAPHTLLRYSRYGQLIDPLPPVGELHMFGGFCDMCLSATAQSFIEPYLDKTSEPVAPMTIYMHMGLIYGVDAILHDAQIDSLEMLLSMEQNMPSLGHFLNFTSDKNGAGLKWDDFVEEVLPARTQGVPSEVRYRLTHKSTGRVLTVVLIIREPSAEELEESLDEDEEETAPEIEVLRKPLGWLQVPFDQALDDALENLTHGFLQAAQKLLVDAHHPDATRHLTDIELESLYQNSPTQETIEERFGLKTLAAFTAYVELTNVRSRDYTQQELRQLLPRLEQALSEGLLNGRELLTLDSITTGQGAVYAMHDGKEVAKVFQVGKANDNNARLLEEWRQASKQLALYEALAKLGFKNLPQHVRLLRLEVRGVEHIALAMGRAPGRVIKFATLMKILREQIPLGGFMPGDVLNPNYRADIAAMLAIMERHSVRIDDLQFMASDTGLIIIDPFELLLGQWPSGNPLIEEENKQQIEQLRDYLQALSESR